MSLLDMLNPASPPPPKAARTVRLLDHKDDECDETLPVAPLDPAKLIPTKEPPVNSKAASIRALLRDHPEGLGYDGLSKGTGIARDSIGKHLANLLLAGDVKGYELAGRGRVFKITGQGADRVGERTSDQVPAKAAPQSSIAADRKPDDGSSPPATDRATVPAATPQPAAPETSVSARPDPAPSLAGGGSTRAADHEPEAPQSPEPVRAGADPISAATSARAPANDGAHALAVELVCIAAKNAIAEVRASFASRELHSTWPELADALANFERADRIYVSTKGRA